MTPVQIRPVQYSDLPQIRAINTHYILHTALTFAQNPPPSKTYHDTFTDLSARGLPYLVAVTDDTSIRTTSGTSAVEPMRAELVLGYAYLSPFRGHLTAYAPTVELSLFLHPSYYSQGIGSRLLAEILSRLRQGEIRHMVDGTPDDDQGGNGSFPHNPYATVGNIIAVMAVDPEGKDGGEALRRWYIKRGFQERGRLSRVGFKRGYWIDTVYLQYSVSGTSSV